MTTAQFWTLLAVFILGLFIGSNLGVMLMCVLRVAGWGSDAEMAQGEA